MTFLELPSCSVIVTLKDENHYSPTGDDFRVSDQHLYALLLRLMKQTLPDSVNIHIAAEKRIYADIESEDYSTLCDFLHLRHSPSFTSCFESVASNSNDEWLVWINARQVLLNYHDLLKNALRPTTEKHIRMTLSVDKNPLLCFTEKSLIAERCLEPNRSCADTFFSRLNLPDLTYYNKSFIAIRRDSLGMLATYDVGSTALVVTTPPLFVDQLQNVFSDQQLTSLLSSAFM